MAYKNIEEIHQPIAQLSFFHSLFHLYAKHLITKESSFKPRMFKSIILACRAEQSRCSCYVHWWRVQPDATVSFWV